MKPEVKSYIIISVAVLIVILAICFNYFRGYSEGISEPVHVLCFSDNCVVRVIDGDTFVLRDNSTVRLICVDAPELHSQGGEEAKVFLESLILNKEVRLERDVSDKDEYERLLRYVYLGDVFVNEELVKSGNADVWRYGNDTARCDEIEG
ncbi:MAG: thermonuclease family protein [Nanoarchaeota archaeon]